MQVNVDDKLRHFSDLSNVEIFIRKLYTILIGNCSETL